jgi:sugar O-acyltransferase (sialic acid O-acetyltransferase NeuD family)
LDEYNIEYPIIGTIDGYNIQEDDVLVIAIGNVKAKKAVAERLSSREARFKTFIHNSTLVSKTARIGSGCVIGPYCLISDHVVLEDFVMLGFYTSCGHDARVGKYGILSPYATLNGFAILEEEVFMGTHSSIAPGRKVGKNSMISSGTAVMYDVPENCLVVGVPGKHHVMFNKPENE